jgi:hypothetical protein
MWEVVMDGKTPFSHYSVAEVMTAVCRRHEQLEVPDYVPPALAEIIQRLYAATPSARPSMQEVVDLLDNLPVEDVAAARTPTEKPVPSNDTDYLLDPRSVSETADYALDPRSLDSSAAASDAGGSQADYVLDRRSLVK